MIFAKTKIAITDNAIVNQEIVFVIKIIKGLIVLNQLKNQIFVQIKIAIKDNAIVKPESAFVILIIQVTTAQ